MAENNDVADCDITSGRVDPQSYDELDRPWHAIGLAAPARRALVNAGLMSMEDLSRVTEKHVAGLHGMGKSAVKRLAAAMAEADVTFANAD